MREIRPCIALVTMALMPLSLASQSRTPWATVDSVAQAALRSSRTPGATLAVVQDGRTVYTKGYGLANVETRQAMHPDMLLRVGSVSKMFTGLLLARLAESGRLDLHAPISRYIPTLNGKRVGSVTTLQLMTHNAGWLDNAVAYGRMGEGALGEVMREVGDTLFFTEPGRTFSYSNPSISMAGYVAEAATSRRFGLLVDSLVLRPAGMTRSTFRPLEALTWPVAMGHAIERDSVQVIRPMTENTAQWPAGFLFASAPELARFTIAMMTATSGVSGAVYPASAVRLATTGVVPHPGGSDIDSATYAFGLTVGHARLGGQRERVWKHGGAINGYNASVVMLPDRRSSVVVIVNGPGTPIRAIEDAALTAIGARLPRSEPSGLRALTADELRVLRGRYAMARTVVEITERDGRAVLQQGPVVMPLQIAADGSLLAQPPAGSSQRVFLRRDATGVPYLYLGSRALARQP